jgi:Rx N-terminal domain
VLCYLVPRPETRVCHVSGLETSLFFLDQRPHHQSATLDFTHRSAHAHQLVLSSLCFWTREEKRRGEKKRDERPQSSVSSLVSFLRSVTTDLARSPITSMELLKSTVLSRVTGAWDLNSDLERLRNSLPRVNHLMEKAEWWRFKDPYIALLLKQLRDAIYDAEDVIAIFDYYQLKRCIEAQACAHVTFFYFL